ncbi:MAG: type II toxin-antitoxin system CcdA family antitoxin [Nitrococcus sp.]|nr:type II toxin-antitoxin system CcdA family antitoxin [Nitrococcus sp.]
MRAASAKQRTNLSLDADLVAAARARGINLSRACERGLRAEIACVDGAQWKAENAGAIASSNAYVVRHGLPLEKFRRF